MVAIYPACFFMEENGYSVVFPDLNWLATCGSNEADAFNLAIDCLAGYIFTMKQDGEKIPDASSTNEISLENVVKQLEADTEGAFVNMISVDVEEYAKIHFK